MPTLYATPYGNKTPELLIQAMDSIGLLEKANETIDQLKFDLEEANDEIKTLEKENLKLEKDLEITDKLVCEMQDQINKYDYLKDLLKDFFRLVDEDFSKAKLVLDIDISAEGHSVYDELKNAVNG